MMKKSVISACIAAGLSHSALAVVLTFDDVPGGSLQGTFGDMPTYSGFQFSSTLDWIDLVGSSWPFGAKSGEFALLNNNGGIGIVTEQNGNDFTFDGLWAKQWNTAPDSGGPNGLFGTISGYNNGGLIWSADSALNGTYKYFSGQVGAIDELRLDFGNHFLVDDLALNHPSAIPEPSTYVLLLLGLFTLFLQSKKGKTMKGGRTVA